MKRVGIAASWCVMAPVACFSTVLAQSTIGRTRAVLMESGNMMVKLFE